MIPPVFRYLTNVDAIIFIHKALWENMVENKKAYYVDEALSMLFATDKTMDDGRPKLAKIQMPRVAFADVVKRHGIVDEDVRAFAEATKEPMQLDLFGLMMGAEMDLKGTQYSGLRIEDRLDLFEEVNEELFMKAARLIYDEQQASVQFLQRHLGISYMLAIQLMDKLAQIEYVGDWIGPNMRKVLVTAEMLQLSGVESATAMEQ